MYYVTGTAQTSKDISEEVTERQVLKKCNKYYSGKHKTQWE